MSKIIRAHRHVSGVWTNSLTAILRTGTGPAQQSSGFALAPADLKLLVLLFCASRLVLAAAIWISYLTDTSRMETGFQDLFCNWDCDWYVGIATNGYSPLNEVGATGAANWAFFPALPAAMWAMSQASGLPVVYCGLIIANGAWALGLYAIFLIARDRAGRDFARHVAFVYAAWPFSIHSAIPMTEALFVPISIAVLLFARRGDWLLAGVSAALLSATRTVGVVAVVPMLILAAREFGTWRLVLVRPGTERALLALALSGLGLAGYMLYLSGLTGDGLAFSHNQTAWNRMFKLPWMMLVDELNPATISVNWIIANICNAGTGLLALAALPLLWRLQFRPEAVFAGLALMIAFNTGSANSLPRYAGGLFPFMVLAASLSFAPAWRGPVLVFLVAGEAILAYSWGLEQFYVM